MAQEASSLSLPVKPVKPNGYFFEPRIIYVEDAA